MTKEEAKEMINEIVEKTIKLIPIIYEENLPPSKQIPDVPQWHDYEYEIWKNGEQIRQILFEHKNLRSDKTLLNSFLAIALNRNAKRGRQSFILLFGYNFCAEYSNFFIEELDDVFVRGHIINVLNKMKTPNYVSLIMPYTTDKIAWIRNEAKKYVKQHITTKGSI
ncbi:MAG TPA: hypothetical protein K8V76_04460 [Bacteroides ovatus]|jgi:hypothetical protein|nr:hypothetical protein [Bacteroides ovatus]